MGHLGCVADVGLRAQGQHPLLFGLGQAERVDEGVQHLFGDLLAPGQVLQFLVGVGYIVFAHQHLDRFSQDFPVFIQFLFQGLVIYLQFV